MYSALTQQVNQLQNGPKKKHVLNIKQMTGATFYSVLTASQKENKI